MSSQRFPGGPRHPPVIAMSQELSSSPSAAIEPGSPTLPASDVSRRRFLVGASLVGLAAALPRAFASTSTSTAAAASAQPDLGLVVSRSLSATATATNPADLSLVEAAVLLRNRQMSSVELVTACLNRITERDGSLNAWVRVYRDDALAQAQEADRVLNQRSADTSVLTGIPIGLKDLIAVGDKPLTAGSGVLTGHIAPGDAPAWAQLRSAGMVLLGHTTTLEFGLGDVAPQTVKNPWDFSRSPGGSSNGSGVALLARMVPAALGTDGAGSIRRPASALGVCGMIGTWGRVPVRGLISSSPSYDHIGPMARSAVDLSLLLSGMCGSDPYDPGTLIAPALSGSLPYVARSGRQPLRGLRFGILNGASFGNLASGVQTIFSRFQQELVVLGATLVDVTAPTGTGLGVQPDPGTIILHRDFYANEPQGYSDPIREKIRREQEQANDPTALAYVEGQINRADYIRKWKQLFVDQELDFFLAPSINVEVPLLDSNPDGYNFGNVNIRREFNIVGFPAISIPAGFSPETDMPVGMQIIGDHWADADVIQVALDYQAHTDYHTAVPEIYQ